MIVTFKATLDDFTEATFHSLKLRKRLRPWYRRLSTYALLLVGIGVGRFLYHSELLKLAIGLEMALILMGCDEFLYRRLIFRRSRDFHLKKLGLKLPMTYEVGLTEEGLTLKEGESESVLAWRDVRSIERTRERFFLNEGDGSVTSIPFSAFRDEAERNRFFETTTGFLKTGEKEKR